MQNSEKAYGWSKPVGDWRRHIGQERGKTGGNMNQEVGQDEKLEVETGRGEQDCYRTGHFACFDYNDEQLWDW